jgi:hypothetical protein
VSVFQPSFRPYSLSGEVYLPQVASSGVSGVARGDVSRCHVTLPRLALPGIFVVIVTAGGGV